MAGTVIVLEDLEEGYYVYMKNATSGPFVKEVLLNMRRNGELSDETFVAVNGEWVASGNILWDDPAQNDDPAKDEPAGQKKESHDISFLSEMTTDSKWMTCPHCWHQFDMSQVYYIAKHPDLIGDPVVGAEKMQRFLPTNFNEQGYAIDTKGMTCTDMACPNCHLPLPVSVTELPSSMYSIVGAPASGKSYYLAAMIWQIRHILAQKYDFTLTDTDETFNEVLNNYESLLFLNSDPDKLVSLPKTELAGADYTNQILLNGFPIDLPKPFVFTLTPTPSNTAYESNDSLLRNIILYDNGGEHFEPGRDSVNNPSTHHLIHSDSIVFLYDPFKDMRLKAYCNKKDPQMHQTQFKGNQLVLLNEMLTRIRKYSGLPSHKKYDKMLVVVIPKYDSWRESFPLDLEEQEFSYYCEKDMKYYLDLDMVTGVSYATREMLMRSLPEVVTTCEAFFTRVYFVPVSACGTIPEFDIDTQVIGVRPVNMKPIWAEVPALLQLWDSGLIEAAAPKTGTYRELENYKFTEDSLIYSLPGKTGRFSVPSNYWGRIVYCDALKEYIKFPEPEETQDTKKEDEILVDSHNKTGQSSVAADNFWNS